MSIQSSEKVGIPFVNNEEIESITKTIDTSVLENATIPPMQRNLVNMPRTKIAQAVSNFDHEDICVKQNDIEGIFTKQGNDAHSIHGMLTDNDTLVIKQRHNLTKASKQPKDEQTYLQLSHTDMDVKVIHVDVLEGCSSAAGDDNSCYSSNSEDYPAESLPSINNCQDIESWVPCDELQCVDYDSDRSINEHEETCIQSKVEKDETVLIPEFETPSIDSIEVENDTRVIEDLQDTSSTLDVKDGISTCAIVEDRETDLIEITEDSQNLPNNIEEPDISDGWVIKDKAYIENDFKLEQETCTKSSVMNDCVTETFQPAGNKTVHILLSESEAVNTDVKLRNTKFVQICNNNSAVRGVSCFERQACLSLNFGKGKDDITMTNSDAQKELDDDDDDDNDDDESCPGYLKHTNQHLQVFSEVKEEKINVNPERRKISDHCIEEQFAIYLASLYKEDVNPREKHKVIKAHEEKQNTHLIKSASCPITKVRTDGYTVDTRQQKLPLHKHLSLCEDKVKDLEKYPLVKGCEKTKSIPLFQSAYQHMETSVRHNMHASRNTRIRVPTTKRGFSAPHEVAKDLPDKTNRYSKPIVNNKPSAKAYQGRYPFLHHIEDLHTRRMYLSNGDSRIEVKKIFHEEHVAFVPKSMLVKEAVLHIKTSLGLGKWHDLDLYCEKQLLHKWKHLKDCSGNNCLHAVQRPIRRQALWQYRTDDADMTNPFEDDDFRVSMSCGHAITPSNLYDYCWSQVNDGFIDITCPAIPNQKQPHIQCRKIWDFLEFSTKACLSTDEKCLFQVVLFQNWIGRNRDVHKCPNCGTYIQSMCNSNRYFICTLCTQRYCIKCYRPWVNSSSERCKNIDCAQSGKILQQQLNSSGVKTIIEVPRCPVVRACPRCCTMIQHDGDACKHMDCPNKMCRIQFCFICLAVKEDEHYWPESCHGAFFKCKVAPIQQVI